MQSGAATRPTLAMTTPSDLASADVATALTTKSEFCGYCSAQLCAHLMAKGYDVGTVSLTLSQQQGNACLCCWPTKVFLLETDMMFGVWIVHLAGMYWETSPCTSVSPGVDHLTFSVLHS